MGDQSLAPLLTCQGLGGSASTTGLLLPQFPPVWGQPHSVGPGPAEASEGTCVRGRLSLRFLWQTQTHQQGNKGEERAVAASFHDMQQGWLPPTLSRVRGRAGSPNWHGWVQPGVSQPGLWDLHRSGIKE